MLHSNAAGSEPSSAEAGAHLVLDKCRHRGVDAFPRLLQVGRGVRTFPVQPSRSVAALESEQPMVELPVPALRSVDERVCYS